MKKLIVLMMAAVMAFAFAGICFAAPADFAFKTVGSEGAVTFSHTAHLAQKVDGQAMSCKNCHTKLFKMKKGGEDITMAAMKEGKFCGGCHDGKTAFSASAAENCAKCHKK